MHLRPVALVALALAVSPAIAHADRVVVGSIRGDERDRVRTRVESALRERVEVVPWSEFRAAYRGMDAEAIRAACRSVDARAIVIGDVLGPRSLNLIALSCETGEIASESEVQLRGGLPREDDLSAALAGMFFQQGARSLLAWATRAGTAAAPRAPAPPVAPPPPAVSARAPAAPAPAPAPTATPVAAPPAAPPDVIASLLDPRPARRAASPPPRIPASAADDEPASAAVTQQVAPERTAPSFLELAVGATFSTRSLVVADRAGGELAYTGGGYTELGGQATLFPAALVTRAPWARAIGLSGTFSKGVGVPAAAGSGLNVDTLDGGGALVGRVVLGRAVPIELRPQVGYGFRGFAIDWNPDVATFNYRFLRVGLDARATLYQRAEPREGTIGGLAVGVTGGYDLVIDVGEAADAYGRDASGGGWDAGAYASVVLGRSLFVTVGGELTRLTATFAGEGTLERLAESSADVYARAYLRAGVALR